jgi:FAD/FMN-containing dehydrogenase
MAGIWACGAIGGRGAGGQTLTAWVQAARMVVSGGEIVSSVERSKRADA